MPLSSIDRINDVVTSVQTARFTQEREMYTEYERSSKWLSEVAKVVKRKLMESCSLERAVKKLKLTKISEEDPNTKENSSPNRKVASSSEADGKPCEQRATNDLNEYISSLNVADLRSELRSRGLVTYGLKRDLQERLFEALRGRKTADDIEIIEIIDDDEPMSQNDLLTSSNLPLRVQPIQEQDIGDNENRNESVTASTNDHFSPSDIKQQSHMTKQKNDEEVIMGTTKPMEDIEEGKSSSLLEAVILLDSTISNNREQSLQSPSKLTLGGKFFKATAKLFSPSTTKSFSKDITSPDASVKSSDMKIQKVSDARLTQTLLSIPPSIPFNQSIQSSTQMGIDGREQNLSNLNMSDIIGSNTGKTPESLHSSNTESSQSQSQYGDNSEASKRSSQSSLAVEKCKEKAEARKARLAEMREKAKAATANPQVTVVDCKTTPIFSVTPVLATINPVISGKNPMPQPTQDTNEERKKALAAQMREKAAAAARKLAEANAKQAAVMEEIPTLSKKSGHSSMKSPSSHPREIREASAKKRIQKQQMALSPMDTYDMSDRDKSDSDDEEEDDRRKADKRIPSWAQKSNLIPALERQFLNGPDRIDPDTIFPEVSTCDLEAIFDQTKTRYVKRTSSGNWTKDRVTASETLVYKRTMGFK